MQNKVVAPALLATVAISHPLRHDAAMFYRCAGCDRPRWATFCPSCLEDIETLRLPPGSGAVFAYEPPLQRALLAWKRGDRPNLTAFFCAQLPAVVCDVVVPVPPAVWRTIWRGLHAATELARALGPVERRALVRWRQAPQMGQTKLARQTSRLFAATPYVKRLAGKHVLLVDDVLTTGSTLAAATSLLQQAGVSRCDSLALARVER